MSNPVSLGGRHVAPRKKKRRPLFKIAVCLGVAACLYFTAVYSEIPFIKKWRTIYIETAMNTMTHQWLATALIPDSVIDKVVDTQKEVEKGQSDMKTDWQPEDDRESDEKTRWEELEENFFSLYPEIDKESFLDWTENNESFTEDGYLLIDRSGLNDGGTTIKTVSGDQVLAIDTENGIVIIKITGADYVARMAIIKDASQIRLEVSPDFLNSGVTVGTLVSNCGAVLGINASGFYDPEGHGTGGTPCGLVISDGVTFYPPEKGRYKAIGFDENNALQIGTYDETIKYRDAIEFRPILVLNGEAAVSGSAGWGISPRSAIGQTASGDVVMVVVDGRAPGYSIGCTIGDVADMMVRYGVYQACNLDGGSSSVLYFRGREISRPSAADKVHGRRVPCGFMVMPK